MNNFEEISKKCTSSSIKNIREKFRVEIKKQKNEETFNSKRLKFSNIIEDESNIIKTTKSLVNILKLKFFAINI